jgi:hypothetical protein
MMAGKPVLEVSDGSAWASLGGIISPAIRLDVVLELRSHVRRSSCQKASDGTALIGGAARHASSALIGIDPASRATGQHETAILIVSRLVADLKPGVFDAPLRGYGA